MEKPVRDASNGFLGAAFAQRARAAGHGVMTADILPGADRTTLLQGIDRMLQSHVTTSP